jgi:ABC-type xylose transport system substrate-binding protein
VPTKGKGTPSILIPPIVVTKANYKVLFADKFLKKSEVCVGAYKKFCK